MMVKYVDLQGWIVLGAFLKTGIDELKNLQQSKMMGPWRQANDAPSSDVLGILVTL
jgi:hypothetical protein